jgi:hypothetical protein
MVTYEVLALSMRILLGKDTIKVHEVLCKTCFVTNYKHVSLSEILDYI